MKILYAIQGTGNGHLSRAIEILPELQKRGNVDVLISGCQVDLDFPFEVKYRLQGLSFIFGKSGGVDYMKTILRSRPRKLLQEIKSLPVEEYDLVVNDFEPVSAWAARSKGVICIGLSNQAAIFTPNVPRPVFKDLLGQCVLRNYAPTTAQIGFHFQQFNDHLFTPIIRKEIRELRLRKMGHYTVYLPAYGEKAIVKCLMRLKDVKWHVFSKHHKRAKKIANIYIIPIDKDLFMESLSSCNGVLCGAGFSTPSEVLYLQKKLMVVPMKKQFEQFCNAKALEGMGVPVLMELNRRAVHKLEEWIQSDQIYKVQYPDNIQIVIDAVIRKFSELRTTSNVTHELVLKPMKAGVNFN